MQPLGIQKMTLINNSICFFPSSRKVFVEFDWHDKILTVDGIQKEIPNIECINQKCGAKVWLKNSLHVLYTDTTDCYGPVAKSQ